MNSVPQNRLREKTMAFRMVGHRQNSCQILKKTATAADGMHISAKLTDVSSGEMIELSITNCSPSTVQIVPNAYDLVVNRPGFNATRGEHIPHFALRLWNMGGLEPFSCFSHPISTTRKLSTTSLLVS